LESDRRIAVAGSVGDGAQAVAWIKHNRADVVLLDIEMPVMDGITALPLLCRAKPAPQVLVASTLTTRGADIALRALRLGAADYIAKPDARAMRDDRFKQDLIEKVLGLARLGRQAPGGAPGAAPGGAPAAGGFTLRQGAVRPPRLIAIGSSTGGPQALFTLVQALGRDVPLPVVLTQHMPASFVPILAAHIDKLGGMGCAPAREGEAAVPGRILVAPGDRHLIVQAEGKGFRVRLDNGPPENFCRPSVDPMLRSASVAADGRVLVVMLTGMGSDGLAGTKAVIAAGGAALAQDEASSIVWGMPGAIARAGLCQAVLPLPQLALRLRGILQAAAP
jgi:two-component system chemotaxis response regulator CheB